ncbi:acyl-CoA dehydrogenase family protein [Cumulibacter manganitolerans]|uniref:acyl-CoA dehydrogenase family protein n=1 Tax=Cumulibacter manganitolerans TaxID=1884992 RepID=UPI0012974841|nr:acyl-CoA dehydrogenase family protein [Cumulibacter manganitolerans]
MQFTAEHNAFREMVRSFVAKELTPHADEWEKAGIFPAHEVFKKAGDLGLLGIEYDEEYGGLGADHLYTMIAVEEIGRMPCGGVPMAFGVQMMMATPSLHKHGSPELKEKYLRPAIAGDMVTSIAVTEPDAGSDVASLRTRAVQDGDDWVINGSKIYITSGTQSDWLCLLARTSNEGGYRGMSQIIVPRDSPGLEVVRKLDKYGMHSSDTAELSFVDVRVPVSNTIGEIGRGFQQQMEQFVVERMFASYGKADSMQRALDRTAEYLKQRVVKGKPLIASDYVAYKLADLSAQIDVFRAHAHAMAEKFAAGGDTTREATISKLIGARLAREVGDWCLQFHGGMGYMEDFWVARYVRDTRLGSIGGGSDETMLQVLARIDGFTP